MQFSNFRCYTSRENADIIVGWLVLWTTVYVGTREGLYFCSSRAIITGNYSSPVFRYYKLKDEQ
ncbi:hypothetical protein CO2235_90111 [Cupriavidus oxalaticus]|uniref:Uncharacterized protein n=1 Tax=Cupriavidus oxalaticus TaxID=96344 RepID=A0A976GBI7_9BURK|nr:hypothetical protein CO2235_90111 [Cupriavidus oxalaticus]